MLSQIFFANINFAVNIIGFLAFFATGWLSIDSWTLDKNKKSFLYRGIGMLLFSLTFPIAAVSSSSGELNLISQILSITGLLIILISLYREPFVVPPSKKKVGLSLLLVSQATIPLSAVLMLLVSLAYLRKSTEGYEKQVKPAFFAFLILSLSEIVRISSFASTSVVVYASELLKQYGPIDNLSLVLKFAGIIILLLWTWGYIRFRFNLQVFITSVARTILTFTAVTFIFTFFLFKNLETVALGHLKTDMGVLQFAVDEVKSRSLSNSKTISQSQTVKDSLKNNQMDTLYSTALEFMNSENTSFLDITDETGKVVVRATDNERVGDSLLQDYVVAKALSGTSSVSVDKKEGTFAPTIEIRAASPIMATGSAIVGSVVAGFDIDNAFVDKIKAITGLDVAVFAGDTRTATTFIAPDGKSRYIGTRESNKTVLENVIGKGETYIGAVKILNQPFYGVYTPIKSDDGTIIGMFFVGNLQTDIVVAATNSIKFTFIGSVILMLLSIVPAWFISNYINRQMEA